jgi:hypothetical protein
MTRASTLTFALVLLACAPKMVKLDEATRESLKKMPEIKVIHYYPPTLQLQGIAPVGYAASAGTAAAVQSQAQNRVQELLLQDPVLRIKTNVVSSLTKLLETTNLTPLPTPMQELQVDKLKGMFGRETILDFATTYWGVAPIPFHPFDLVLYRARARLLRFPEGTLLWQGNCDLEAEDSAGMPTEREVLITKGLLLSNTLNRLADRCSEQLVAQFSGKQDLN